MTLSVAGAIALATGLASHGGDGHAQEGPDDTMARAGQFAGSAVSADAAHRHGTAHRQADDVEHLALSMLALHAARAIGRDPGAMLGLDGGVPAGAQPPAARARPVAFHAAGGDSADIAPARSAGPDNGGRQADAGGVAVRGRLSSIYDGLIEEVARQHEVAPHLVRAVIKVESNFQSDARSPKGAMGLMQVMPATGRRFGASDLLDPRDNVSAGTRYLRWLLDRFGGDLTLALAAYNAGEGAVEKHGRRVPPYAETQGYVRKVLDHLDIGPDRALSQADSTGETRIASRSGTVAVAPAAGTPAVRRRPDAALQRVSAWFGAILTSGSRRDPSTHGREHGDATGDPRVTSWPVPARHRNGSGPV